MLVCCEVLLGMCWPCAYAAKATELLALAMSGKREGGGRGAGRAMWVAAQGEKSPVSLVLMGAKEELAGFRM